MNHFHVLSAFLDNEPFDAADLDTTLSDPAGRRTLIELMGLRHIVQVPMATPPLAQSQPSQAQPQAAARPARVLNWRYAAVVFLALGAGYAIGLTRTSGSSRPPRESIDASAPPTPTIVVPTSPAATWDTTRKGQ